MRSQPERLGAIVCLLLPFAGAAHAAADEALILERELLMLGTRVRIQVAAADPGSALAASEAMAGALERAEAVLSTWREDTELARVNRAPAGVAQPIGGDLHRWLQAARLCEESTAGAFDPAVGALVDAWGLRVEGDRRRPTPEQRRRAVETTGLGAWRLGPGSSLTRIHPRVRLEEGGFGKGAALDAAVAAGRVMSGVSGGLVDVGGQVGVWGNGAERVLLADPRDRDRPVVAVPISSGSLATSGNGVRGIVVDGRAVGHLLDPRTGEPVADFGSLTVWAPEGLQADCLSTGLYVLGPDAALNWAARHAGVEVLVLEPRGQRLVARASAGLVDRLEPLIAELTVVRDAPRHHAGDSLSSSIGALVEGADLQTRPGPGPVEEN
ncbi:MAG: FAD:protein FMN transferase [Thermoanaerobaculia bacterium]